jgi:dihydroorotase
MPRLLIRNASVVFPDRIAVTSVLCDQGRIVAIDASPTSAADQVIEGKGKFLLPGVIDDQVHFREPGLTHKEDLQTASLACAAGGITSFLEMPNTKPSATTRELVEAKYQIADQKSHVNYGFYIGASTNNVDELRQATNIPGIKIFIGSSTGDLLVDEQDALERIFAESTLPICAHCEDEATVRANMERIGPPQSVADHSRIRDEAAAVIATKRATDLAKRHHHRFHVLHVSTAAELPIILDHQRLITGEACVHHLLFSIDDYARLGTLVQMNPSLKTREDAEKIWIALHNDTLQVIATDHAPHTLEEKQRPYPQSPSGLPAVENSLALILDQANQGKCSLLQVAHWMSDSPARIWGLVGKGRIAPGYDADLVLVDMAKRHTIRNEEQITKCGWSPWHGCELQGWPVATIIAGQLLFKDGQLLGKSLASRLQCDHQRGGYWATADGIGTR